MDEIADSPINKTRVAPTPSMLLITSIPAWLQHGSKVSYGHKGQFHKGFMMITSDGTARFSFRHQQSSKEESWGVSLPNLVIEGPTLNCDNILQPSWNVYSFLRSANPAPTAASFISASHVLACDLKAPCSPFLMKSLHEGSVDISTWHDSNMEEKNGLIENYTYDEISLQEYRCLRCLPKGVPKSTPKICVVTIKREKRMNSNRAKSCIVVLGNIETRLGQKSEKYAPVL